MKSRMSLGTIQDQTCPAKQNNTLAPSDRHSFFCPSPSLKEGNHIQIQDHDDQYIAGTLCASKLAIPIMSKTDGHYPVNKVTTRNKADSPFDDSNSVHIADSNLNRCWTCPKCHAQWRRDPERLVNLEQSGRHFFECSSQHCGIWLVVTKRKDNISGEFTPGLVFPPYTKELCRYSGGASRAACTRRVDDI